MTATLNITAEITDFARRVREQLADLSRDEVDDLTDGLDADMAEAFAETPDFRFPDPATYALELRTAAGLPVQERQRGGIRQSFGGVADSIRMMREGLATNLRSSPTMAKLLDALVELRPVWWLLRAWVAFVLVSAVFGREGPVLPFDVLGWFVFGLFAAVSVQWGRKQWLPFGWLSGLIVIGNIAAALFLLPAAALTNAWSAPYDDYAYANMYEEETMSGVTLNNNEVTNIFAYGADGKPLKGVQLFDQDGHPLRTTIPGDSGCLDADCVEEGEWVPSMLETGAKAWNVFPMQMVLAKLDETTGEYVLDPAAQAQDRQSPFIKVPAILAPTEKAAPKVPKNAE